MIAGPPDSHGARAATLESGQAVLVDFANEKGSSTWLLWDGRRSQIDLANHAVTNALGLGVDVPALRPIASGLFNAIPEAPSLTAPGIPNAGAPANFGVPAPIGAVVVSYALDQSSSGAARYYAVLPDGLQPISPVLAAILRNTNSYGLDQPPRLGADEVAKLPVSRMLDTARYPDRQIAIVDAAKNPVTCAYWSKPAGAATSSLGLMSGSALPVADAVRTLDLVGAGSGSTQAIATRVALAPGTGYFTQTVGGGPTSPGNGSLFWVSDTGVRYGIDNEADSASGAAGHGKTVAALGLSAPAVPIPWSMLSLFANGPDAIACRRAAGTRRLATRQQAGPAGVGRRRTPMSRLIFEARRRLAPPSARKGSIAIEAPPELPRVIPPSLLRRAMPVVIVMLIVGMVVALFATGMRVISPQTLFFPFVLLLAATALYRGTGNKMRTEEVDAERADYLRYLSVVRDNIRTQAAEQRAAAQWSHPDPTALATVPGSRRQWERDPHDPDFLVLRAGRAPGAAGHRAAGQRHRR